MGILYLFLGFALAIAIRLALVFGTAWFMKLFWQSTHWTRVRTAIVVWVLIEGGLTIAFFQEFTAGMTSDEIQQYLFGTVFAGFVYFSLWRGNDDEKKIEEEKAKKDAEETFD